MGQSIETENKNFSEDYNQLLRLLGKLRLEEIAAINLQFCRQYQEQMKNYPGFTQEMIKALTANK